MWPYYYRALLKEAYLIYNTHGGWDNRNQRSNIIKLPSNHINNDDFFQYNPAASIVARHIANICFSRLNCSAFANLQISEMLLCLHFHVHQSMPPSALHSCPVDKFLRMLCARFRLKTSEQYQRFSYTCVESNVRNSKPNSIRNNKRNLRKIV